jgi:SAM-dependent methyltransferase
MDRHDHELEQAFDRQAAQFERAPVQTDPTALSRLVAFAAFPPDSRVLDAGCGPGLVAEALLTAGLRVHGVDLSSEMVRRARQRCFRFGDRASFEQGSLLSQAPSEAFDGAISRLVLHHLDDPLAFVRRQVELVRPGGVVVASDHTGDPEPGAARWHEDIERWRDRTHVRNPTPGEIADLLARAGLESIALVEERFELDFDEWFDRGTPGRAKDEVRAVVLTGRARGYEPSQRHDGGITVRCFRASVRGVKPRA